VNLQKQLSLALLLLALVPSALISVFAFRQVLQVDQLWASAGLEEALASSVTVAKQSLTRMSTDLDYAAGPLTGRWLDRAPDFRTDAAERRYVARFLRDVGLDFVHVYAPDGDGYRLESMVYPESTLVTHDVDLAAEIAALEPTAGPLQSASGAFAQVRDVAGGRRVAVGYLLQPDFFGRLSELQLGLGTYRAVTVYARVFRTYLIVVLAVALLLVAGLALLAAGLLSRRLAGPVALLSGQLREMKPQAPQRVATPAHATPEVRELAEVINQWAAELQRAERVAGSAQVARQVAHEIKNSLSTLEYATVSLEGGLAHMPQAERRSAVESLAAMSKEFQVLKEMSETFSLLGRMAEPLIASPLDVNGLLASVRAPYTQADVRVDLDLEPGLPPVLGDERALRRVLTNLVKNAIEAQGGGGAAGEGAPLGAAALVIRSRRDGAAVRIEVADRGPGIAPEVLARVFDPGFSTKREPGSGFGLFLARSVVEQHGGSIVLESAPSAGTTASIRLPAAPAVPAPA
jgi:signal transduction histidine kinase